MSSEDTITFYHNPQSRASMVHWMLEEVEAPYQAIILDLRKGEQKAPDYLKLNPMGKIPTIVHRGTVVTETPAIIAYLADTFPAAGLAPPVGERERGTYYRWLFFGAACYEPALFDKVMDRPPPSRPGALGSGSFEDVLRTIETAIQPGPYLLGERFSAADLYIGAELAWSTMFGGPGLKENDRIQDYVARVTDRPAYRRANAS